MPSRWGKPTTPGLASLGPLLGIIPGGIPQTTALASLGKQTTANTNL
jgi:hypothetical protein